MTMACKICNNSKRLEIDRDLVAGKNISKLAKKYGVPRASLDYHKATHLSRQLLKAQETRDLLTAERLTDDIEFMLKAGREIFDEAREDKSHCWSLGALASLRETWAFVAKVHSMIQEEKKEQAPTWDHLKDNLSIDELGLLGNLMRKANGENVVIEYPDKKGNEECYND